MGISSGKGPRVAVLMGGHSLEREVSLVSGQACAAALRGKDFQVLELDAGRDIVQRLSEVRPDVVFNALHGRCLLYTSPSPRDPKTSRMPSSA